MKIANHFKRLHRLMLGIMLLGTSCLASPPAFETATPIPISISTSAPAPTDSAPPAFTATAVEEVPPSFTIHYTLDRPSRPQLTYQDVSLSLFVGDATSVSAWADGEEIPVAYDPQTGLALVTTAKSKLDVAVQGGIPTPETGHFSLAALKDNRQWAWSHSFDDNVFIEQRGVPAFDNYGWRATVYLIGSKLDDTREEDWILDRPDIVALLGKGWGIGNHSWSHANVADFDNTDSARQNVIRMAGYIRQIADEAGYPGYYPIGFAAPNFDNQYHPIILELRDQQAAGLLFNESGDIAILRVDPEAAAGLDDEDDPFAAFNPDAPVGRDWRIEQYGTGNEYDQSFQADIALMLSLLDSNRHYWLNTFTHGVDDRPEDQIIFGFIDWLYHTHGPGGSDSVWVAPSEEIYSYLLLRDRAEITFTISEGANFPGD